MKRKINTESLIGRHIGGLTVICRGEKSKDGHATLVCQCDCGVQWTSKEGAVASGRTKRCWQCANKRTGDIARTHGLRRVPEYSVWVDMRRRCCNPRHKKYRDWGGRGIKVCEEWSDFARFYEDMGQRPGKGYSIERKDNDGHYCKDNCVWATMLEQNRNKRRKK